MQVIYIDTLFLLNFAMDFLSLTLCGTVLHMPRKMRYLLPASFLGAGYAILAVVFRFPFWAQAVFLLPTGGLLCRIAFRRFFGWRRFFCAVAIYCGAALVIGGAVNALYEWMETYFSGTYRKAIGSGDVVLLVGFGTACILLLLSRFFDGEPQQRCVSVSISVDGKSVTLSLLVDSGCLLQDPISGKPALVVRLDALRTLLPDEILVCARAQGLRMPASPVLARRCRLLPVKSLGDTCLLLGIRPDKLTLSAKEGNVSRECDALIALYAADKTRFDGYDGVVPSVLLQ